MNIYTTDISMHLNFLIHKSFNLREINIIITCIIIIPRVCHYLIDERRNFIRRHFLERVTDLVEDQLHLVRGEGCVPEHGD